MNARSWIYAMYERVLRWQCRHIPTHIAIIQDGNRRFARSMGLDVGQGHRLGADTTERMLEWARELGIRHITLYCFSTENFERDDSEIYNLFTLFKEKFTSVMEDERVRKRRIRIQVLGDRACLPADLLDTIERAEAATRDNHDYYINIALAYGGRNEIVHAARSILREVRDGTLSPGSIDPDLVEKHIISGLSLPPVDLIVRTGNERRTSNFLPWLANGNECAVYFCAPNWPRFRKIDLLRAIRVYDQRMQLLERQQGKLESS